MNARYYNANTGQFTSRDTYLGNAYNPQTHNLYSYTGNNPINFIDPTGHKYNFLSRLKTAYRIGAFLFDTFVKHEKKRIEKFNNFVNTNIVANFEAKVTAYTIQTGYVSKKVGTFTACESESTKHIEENIKKTYHKFNVSNHTDVAYSSITVDDGVKNIRATSLNMLTRDISFTTANINGNSFYATKHTIRGSFGRSIETYSGTISPNGIITNGEYTKISYNNELVVGAAAIVYVTKGAALPIFVKAFAK